jgi:hypothetical protein
MEETGQEQPRYQSLALAWIATCLDPISVLSTHSQLLKRAIAFPYQPYPRAASQYRAKLIGEHVRRCSFTESSLRKSDRAAPAMIGVDRCFVKQTIFPATRLKRFGYQTPAKGQVRLFSIVNPAPAKVGCLS